MIDASSDGMSRRKDYWKIIAEHIAAVVERRQIEDVLHFTRLENLPGILEYGLRTRSELVNADLTVYASDADRLDRENNAVSVSISCYYPLMFEAKRHRAGEKPWVILGLHPSLLWPDIKGSYDVPSVSSQRGTRANSGPRGGDGQLPTVAMGLIWSNWYGRAPSIRWRS